MENKGTVIRRTRSLCPVCQRQVEAAHVQRGQEVFLEKTCEEHGFFSAVIWRGSPSIEAWRGPGMPLDPDNPPPCPEGCGICKAHRQTTCCVMLHLTDRCNLHCGFCFADSEKDAVDPPLDEVKGWIDELAERGLSFLHLTGGEPTVREDLPEIIRYAADRGFRYIQLNTNGVRLGEEEGYAKRLAEQGLSCVFLQFDGMEDSVYRKLRGQALLDVKKRAVDACGACRLGVTLVPMLVPGVNVSEIGAILRYAVSKSPAVRGIHFQPVSYFGRYPQPPADAMRITLPEVLGEIVRQSQGLILPEHLHPSGCDHAMCGFHGDFVVSEQKLLALTGKQEAEPCCCKSVVPAEKNQQFVERRWKRRECCCETEEATDSFTAFLQETAERGFTVTGMAFQDLYNLDLERLCQCSLHVYSGGKILPFCAYYNTREKTGA